MRRPHPVWLLQTWVGTPAIYVFDCSAAGQILYSFRVRGRGGFRSRSAHDDHVQRRSQHPSAQLVWPAFFCMPNALQSNACVQTAPAACLQQFMFQRQQEMEGGYLQHQQAAAAAAAGTLGSSPYGERAALRCVAC